MKAKDLLLICLQYKSQLTENQKEFVLSIQSLMNKKRFTLSFSQHNYLQGCYDQAVAKQFGLKETMKPNQDFFISRAVKKKKAMMIIIVIFFSVLCKASDAQVDTTKAVIHHTLSHDVSAEEIDRWHKERGWDGIGYHFVIRKDGLIEKGRSLKKKGAHAKSGGANRNHWVGIVLTGYDDFTFNQIASLKKLLNALSITHIERHHNTCPGENDELSKFITAFSGEEI